MYTHQYDLSRLGIISVVFNPVRYRARYDRYRKFSNHMARSGVNLFTVECIFDSATRFGLPPQQFEVTRSNDPQHFQFVAPSVIWMKENLINIVVQNLPPHIDRIAWVDADVEFERPDWPRLTMNALEQYPIVQMFKIGYFTGPGGKHEVLRRDHSFGYSIRRGKQIYPNNPHWYAHPGYAWAMHRDAFNAMGGLLDFCIVGSGDLHLAYALLGRVQETFPSGLHRDYRKLTTSWGDGVARVAGGGAFVGYANVNLYHHWHGNRDHRDYIGRWSILSRYQFSPRKDLGRDNHSGLLYLTDKRFFGLRTGDARIEEMEQAIVGYFMSRDEDNRRVLPIIEAPRYRVQPAPRRRRRGFPYSPNRRRRRPVAPIIQPVASHQSRRRIHNPGFY